MATGTIADAPEWTALAEHAKVIKSTTHLKDLVADADRCAAMSVLAEDMLFDFSRQNATTETKELLLNLARAADVEGRRNAMFAGEKINTTENRAVFHPALRAPKGSAPMLVDGVDMVAEVHTVLDAMADFSDRVRSGAWLGSTGKPLATVVAVGIGGSYLGPEFLCEALKTDPAASAAAEGRTLRFLANVDPVDFKRATAGLDPETTLVVIVSKTFTTAETMLNARTIRKWLTDGIEADNESIVRQHVVACSSALDKTAAFGIDPANVFGFWDWVGGRFSVHSAVGVLPLSLQYGFPIMREFLDGAHSMDQHFLTAPLEENLPVLLGLFGLWNSSFLGHATRAVLPYSQALLRFPAHLQQLDMESNGKSVALDGTFLPFQTGEILFGEPGTNGQHSFYQLMHQGRVIPAEFIGACKSPNPVFGEGEKVASHDELMCNFFAQADALACGKTMEECAADGDSEELQPHKAFSGNRPSMSILVSELTPFKLGQLLVLYEHRVAVQGMVWNINSFDQWGVQLGKVLAGTVRTQLVASRADADAAIEGFNPSSASMLQFYLNQSK